MRDDEQTRILADVEHLLKTPLLSAMRRCDAALQQDAPTRDDVVLIRALCARMWSQLTTFRAFSRLASNEPLRPNLAPLSVVEITRILQSAVQDASVLDRNHSHHFKVSVEANRDLVIEVDTTSLEMVVRELIDNAVKYTVSGGHIQITLRERNGDTLVLSVTNESPLIPPENIKLLFERGYRGKHAQLTTPGGAGIGLFLVKAVMNAQQGDVRVESHGRLFTTTLEFPIKPVVTTKL
jgi:signal transduction histidine kinase